MRHARLRSAVAIVIGLTVTGCGGMLNFDPRTAPEHVAEYDSEYPTTHRHPQSVWVYATRGTWNPAEDDILVVSTDLFAASVAAKLRETGLFRVAATRESADLALEIRNGTLFVSPGFTFDGEFETFWLLVNRDLDVIWSHSVTTRGSMGVSDAKNGFTRAQKLGGLLVAETVRLGIQELDKADLPLDETS